MPNPGPSDQRQRAVLAAVLAVKRGFLSPDEAMGILEQVEVPAPGQPAPAKPAVASTLLAIGPADEPVILDDASNLLLAKASPSARAEIVREVESLSNDPAKAAETLGFGVAPTRIADNAAVKQTLLAVAATTHVDKKPTSARLAAVQNAATRYEIKRELARGGMGRVLIAMDNAVGREVALKELLPQKSGTTISQRMTTAGELAERFLREAKVTGQLEHPNIIPVYEIGTRDDGSVFYTMKLIRGTTLADRIKSIEEDKTLGPATKQVARLKLLEPFVDVCNAMAYAHSRGVIHRDLKPANVMLGDFGETLVLDWGLARVKGQVDEAAQRLKHDTPNLSPSLVGTDSQSRTLDGSVIGTPAYMPPEQAMGELSEVDEKSDVYALGAMLYEILAARAPYEGANANLILGKVQNLPPDPLAQTAPYSPLDLRALVEKAMARSKSERLSSALALGDEVRAFREGRRLSVYRYSRAEKARKFVARNKLASVVSVLALLAIVAITGIAFVNVLQERNDAQLALARAEKAEADRIALENEQKAEHARLVDERRTEVDTQRRKLVSLDSAGGVAARARKRVVEFRTLSGQVGVPPEELTLNRALTSELLALCAARAELLRLLTEPIAGRSPEFTDALQLQSLRDSLAEDRLLAAQLAKLSEDFALAQYIIDGTPAPQERLTQERAALEEARGSLLKRHADLINATLSRLRADRARASNQTDEFNEMVNKLSALRERQTVELLALALRPHSLKASRPDPQRLWSQPEREEITLVCRVFSRLEMPDLTVPPLADFLEVIDDERLAIEAAVALCLTESWRAETPLLNAAKRFERRPVFWNTVGRFMTRVPEAPETGEPKTAAEFLERGRRRVLKGKAQGAYDDYCATIKLDPNNAEAFLARGMLNLKGEDADLADMKQALAVNPRMGRAYVRIAQIMMARKLLDSALEAATKATEVEPEEPTGWAARGNIKGNLGDYHGSIADYSRAIEIDPYRYTYFNNRAIAYISIKEYERAIVDCTRALDLDPYLQEGWANRSMARLRLGDTDGALADATRILELAPRYSWGYSARAAVRTKRRDFVGAEYDLARAVEFAPWAHHFWLLHARALRALKRLDDAIAVCERCLKEQPVIESTKAALLRYIALLQMERSGATAVGETGLKALQSCAAFLGEAERANEGDLEPLRKALVCLTRGLATLGDQATSEAKAAAALCVEELDEALRTQGYYLDLAALLADADKSGALEGGLAKYNAACAAAKAAEIWQSREFIALGVSEADAKARLAELRATDAAGRDARIAALKDLAFAWLEKARVLGFTDAAHLSTDPDLACLRDDPRFEALLAKMK